MKKGFTLIELLAVIVILAIIAVIATPIVLNIIKDTKESARIVSGEIYLDSIDKSIALAILNNIKIKDGKYPITQEGNLCIGKLDNNVCTGDILTVEMDGNIPNGGILQIKDRKIINASLVFDNKIISKNEKNKLQFGININDYIKTLYSETTTTTLNKIEYSLDEEHLLMNDRLGSSSVDKTDGNIRYYGANPNNYIDIGDRDKDGNIIFWRIIGLFKDIEVTDEEGNVVKTEDLVKIIRADELTSGDVNSFVWDYKYDGTTSSYTNDWPTSTLNKLLNGAYYNSATTSFYNASKIPITLNFSSTGLSKKVHSKIERVNWNLGEHNSSSIYINQMYEYERLGSNKWSGLVGLINPSDYGYSVDLSSCQSKLYNYDSSICQSTTWMNESVKAKWTLNSNSSSNYVFLIFANGGSVRPNGYLYRLYSAHPILYLKSDVSIIEEKETSEGLKYLVVG